MENVEVSYLVIAVALLCAVAAAIRLYRKSRLYLRRKLQRQRIKQALESLRQPRKAPASSPPSA